MAHPVILDSKHQYTRLLIKCHHVKTVHQFKETVVNNLPQKYWITHLRSAVKINLSNAKFVNSEDRNR